MFPLVSSPPADTELPVTPDWKKDMIARRNGPRKVFFLQAAKHPKIQPCELATYTGPD
jgi:hypothetical protein